MNELKNIKNYLRIDDDLTADDEILSELISASKIYISRSTGKKFVNDEEVAPEKFDLDKDGQGAHANIAIASSNLVGKGPGNSVQRDWLPQAFSDFIYAIIIEEMGLWGAVGVCYTSYCCSAPQRLPTGVLTPFPYCSSWDSHCLW